MPTLYGTVRHSVTDTGLPAWMCSTSYTCLVGRTPFMKRFKFNLKSVHRIAYVKPCTRGITHSNSRKESKAYTTVRLPSLVSTKRTQIEMADDHLTAHFLDYIRQAVMCNGDVVPVLNKWEPNVGIYTPEFGTKYMCRDFDGISQWAKSRNRVRGTGPESLPRDQTLIVKGDWQYAHVHASCRAHG